ncbi:MAG: CDP-glycerol glycerophosphotransferase family protein [Ruminococcus sp.]|nr:CDP-glycerol glycerophosphotransferase family protein [Ruminococcus sp.]
MQYKIKINSLVVEKQSMTIDLSGEFIDKSINSKFLSTPKVILYFDNGEEDRRIPLVIRFQDITYIEGKCMFSGVYTYRLDYVFWKTRGKGLPFDLYFNLSFADFYEEKVPINVTPEEFVQDKKFFVIEDKKNHFSITSKPEKIVSNNRKGSFVSFLDSFIKLITLVFSICLIPFFVIEALLTFTGFKNMPSKIQSENKLVRMVSYIIYRCSKVSRENLTMDGYKRSLIRRKYKHKKHKKVQPNKITFFSARREDLSGNFEFVYNKIKDDKNLDINFLFNTKSFRYMTRKEIDDFAEVCATSKVIILDEYTPQIHLIDLKPETKVIQLWHACGAFKTFGFTRIGKPKGSPQATRMHRSYDYVTVSSEFCRKCHSEGFGISTKNIIPTGIARTDIFFDEEYKNNFREQFYSEHPNFKDKKIILFAPTFRGDLKQSARYPMELFDLHEVCETLGEDYAVIIKHHPFITEKHPIPEEYKDRVIDLSESTEINDLLFISDVIISDYSSLVFEASLLNIPMLFYAYDLQAYIKSRDFYFDFKLYIPGKICTSLYTLLQAIKEEDFETEKIERFRNMFFDDLDGKSSERIAQLIYKCLE